jgi:hypothetical protein
MARLQAKPVTANEPMTAAQAATLKNLANAAYELDAFKPNLTRAEAEKTHYHANGQAQAA